MYCSHCIYVCSLYDEFCTLYYLIYVLFIWFNLPKHFYSCNKPLEKRLNFFLACLRVLAKKDTFAFSEPTNDERDSKRSSWELWVSAQHDSSHSDFAGRTLLFLCLETPLSSLTQNGEHSQRRIMLCLLENIFNSHVAKAQWSLPIWNCYEWV